MACSTIENFPSIDKTNGFDFMCTNKITMTIHSSLAVSLLLEHAANTLDFRKCML